MHACQPRSPALPFGAPSTRLRVVFRRLAAIAIAGALLHVNAARAEAACATHEHTPAAEETRTGQESSGHHGEHDVTHAAPATDHDEQSCERPVEQDCCIALMTCSLAFGSAESLSAAFAVSHERAVAGPYHLPLSRVSTPDPPPPKV